MELVGIGRMVDGLQPGFSSLLPHSLPGAEFRLGEVRRAQVLSRNGPRQKEEKSMADLLVGGKERARRENLEGSERIERATGDPPSLGILGKLSENILRFCLLDFFSMQG